MSGFDRTSSHMSISWGARPTSPANGRRVLHGHAGRTVGAVPLYSQASRPLARCEKAAPASSGGRRAGPSALTVGLHRCYSGAAGVNLCLGP